MSAEFIKVENLHYSYRNYYDEKAPEKEVLKGISLSIKKGEFLAVLGHNGSGKSTLAKHFNAILTPTSGRVTVNGIDTADGERLFDLRRQVGMVFQNPDNQIVSSIVEEDVAFALENLGVEPAEMRIRIDEALKAVDMCEYRLHSPSQLSGGQKQRVAIAGIIAMRPECIVLDEPVAMLDPKGRKEVMRIIRRLNREFGVTIVLITHYMDDAAQCDRVVVLNGGQILLDGSPRNVFSNVEKLKQIGLVHLLRRKGIELDKHIISEDDCVDALERIIPSGKVNAAQKPAKDIQKKDVKPIVSCKGLTYTYSPSTPFEKIAVNSIDLEIDEGKIIGVMGHTGSGKSTLIQHFNGLLKPTQGRILIDGKDIWAKENKKNIRSIRFKVGLVFQYPEYQLFEETVFKDIAFGPRNMGLSKDEIKKRVLETAASLGLSAEILEQSPFDLSGGQKRRVAIAGVMAMQPQVLILDEPTAGLDPKGRDMLLEQIKLYHEKTGNTVLLVSHSMEDLAKISDKILVMNKSKVFCYDETVNVFSRSEEIIKMGLDVPQITHVFNKLRERGIDFGKEVFTVEYAKNLILRNRKIIS